MHEEKLYMPPPWMMFPEYTCSDSYHGRAQTSEYCRMYKEWYESLSDEEKQKVSEMFPVPKTWMGCDMLPNADESEKRRKEREPVPCDDGATRRRDAIDIWTQNDTTRHVAMPDACLSPLHRQVFRVNEAEYWCVMQFVLYYEALLFERQDIAKQVMAASTIRNLFSISSELHELGCDTLQDSKDMLFYMAYYHKLASDRDSRERLLATAPAKLFSHARFEDAFKISPMTTVITRGKGFKPITRTNRLNENFLGKLLMKMRDEFEFTWKNYDAADWDTYNR